MNNNDKLKEAILALRKAEEEERTAQWQAAKADGMVTKARDNTKKQKDELSRVIQSLGLEEKTLIYGIHEYRLFASGSSPFLHSGLFEGIIIEVNEPILKDVL
jgi:hypothetical protein